MQCNVSIQFCNAMLQHRNAKLQCNAAILQLYNWILQHFNVAKLHRYNIAILLRSNVLRFQGCKVSMLYSAICIMQFLCRFILNLSLLLGLEPFKTFLWVVVGCRWWQWWWWCLNLIYYLAYWLREGFKKRKKKK